MKKINPSPQLDANIGQGYSLMGYVCAIVLFIMVFDLLEKDETPINQVAPKHFEDSSHNQGGFNLLKN